MVPPIFFSAALAGCRVLRCCAKPGVSTSPGQTAGYADAFQFVTQAPRQSARPWFPAVPTKWGHLVLVACSKAFGCGPLPRCVRFTSQLSIGIG